MTQYKVDIALWKGHDVQQTEEFSYLIFMKCVLNSFELGGEKGRKTHTKKDRQLKTPVEKLTLVIWAPKLEGFAFNTSAENFTSQRKKGKNKTRVEERGKKKKASITTQALLVNLQTIILNNREQSHQL